MDKQKLIESITDLPSDFSRQRPMIDKLTALELIKLLDEPEAGHADEAPRYVKNILARLRELPLHDREVWLIAIMGEFEQDFSHAKWREGYEQGKLEGAWVGNQLKDADKIRQELNKPVVPQFVADVIEGAREKSPELEDALHYTWFNGTKEFTEWYNKKSNRDLFARAWLDGYEVEKEKRYLVKVKGVNEYGCYLNKGLLSKEYFLESKAEIGGCRTKHTRKQLEDDDFGWVFDCPGIEIEEVE